MPCPNCQLGNTNLDIPADQAHQITHVSTPRTITAAEWKALKAWQRIGNPRNGNAQLSTGMGRSEPVVVA